MIHELKSLRDIWRRRPSADHARKLPEQLVWADGRVCPHCGVCGEDDTIPLRGKSSRSGNIGITWPDRPCAANGDQALKKG